MPASGGCPWDVLRAGEKASICVPSLVAAATSRNSGIEGVVRTMKCQHAQYLISKLIDGEVSPSSREQLRQHVRACEGCDKTYKRLFALESLLDESFEPF